MGKTQNMACDSLLGNEQLRWTDGSMEAEFCGGVSGIITVSVISIFRFPFLFVIFYGFFNFSDKYKWNF